MAACRGIRRAAFLPAAPATVLTLAVAVLLPAGVLAQTAELPLLYKKFEQAREANDFQAAETYGRSALVASESSPNADPHDLIDLPANLTVGAEHLRDSRLRSPTDKRIAQLAHHAFHCGVMDVGVRTIEIAEGLLQATIA